MINRAYEEAFGVNNEAARGKHLQEVLEDDFAKDIEAYDRKVAQSGKPMVHEHFATLKSGGVWLFSVRFPIRNENGAIVAIGSIATDVTEFRQTEEALRKAEKQYHAVVEDQTEMISRQALDGTRTFVNESYCRSHGKNKEQLLGQSVYDGMAQDDIGRLKALYRTLTPENPTGEFEIAIPGPDGETNWQLWTKRAIFDSEGRVKEYQAVGHDISKRKRAEAAVQTALAEAKRANSAKSAFLATMSHEFRTPLNAILGFSELLREQHFGPLGADNYREYANDIHRSGEHMLALINDVLDISAIEAGKRSMIKEPIAIKELLEKCVRDFEPAADARGIDLTLDAPNNMPILHADERSVTQIVLNILSNAIKFTDRNGKVAVLMKAAYQRTTIEIRDTGIGIAPSDLSSITEPFSQSHSDPHKAQDGTGLGLSIAKSLIEALDGSMTIESEVGLGTTVSLVFPNDERLSIDAADLDTR